MGEFDELFAKNERTQREAVAPERRVGHGRCYLLALYLRAVIVPIRRGGTARLEAVQRAFELMRCAHCCDGYKIEIKR